MEADLRCHHHPDREATGQCDRCGDYLCADCQKQWKQQLLCPTCKDKRQPSPEFTTFEIAILVVCALLPAVLLAMGLLFVKAPS